MRSRIPPLLIIISCLSLFSPTRALAVKEKTFALAKDSFGRGNYVDAAALCWKYISMNKPGAEKYESAQFFLASSLEKLGLYHSAVEYYFQVASNRRSPELLPRAIKALEAISLERPIDKGMILRDLIGDTDFGALPDGLIDFVYFWQGMTNLERGLDDWASERFALIDRMGYYFFNALYVSTIRLLSPGDEKSMLSAVESFARLFGGVELGSALEALRRRGEADSKLAYSLKSLINDDNDINVRFSKLPKGWEVELALLGLARISAETKALVSRAKYTDEESLGLPLSYQVRIGGLPVFARSLSFEERGPAIKAVAQRVAAVHQIQGKSLHSLARLLYEQKQFAAAYNTLGTIPTSTELSSEILLERAWAKYKAGDPHRAMGLLYALDAPVYRKLFAPEKYLLRGMIYRRFCHFRAAKLAAQKFRIKFGKTLRDIRDGKPLNKIKRVRNAALRRVQSREIHLFNRSLRQEYTTLADWADEWEKGGLLKQLRLLYKKKRQQIKDELNASLEITTREVAEEMLDAEEQVNLLEYEVGQAIFQRVGESSSSTHVRKHASKVPISSERTYYIFSGEYWTHELPHYKFNIEDRCVE